MGGGGVVMSDPIIRPLPPEQHAAIMAALNASEGMSPAEWDAMFEKEDD